MHCWELGSSRAARLHSRSDGAGCRRTHETNRFAAPADGPNELAARRLRRSVADGGRFVVPRGLRKSTDWLAYVFDIGGISRRIYASETVFVSLYLRRGISRRNAWGSGVDCGAGPTRVGNSDFVRDFVPLAVSAFLFDCMAVPGRLRTGWGSDAAGGRTTGEINGGTDRSVFDSPFACESAAEF